MVLTNTNTKLKININVCWVWEWYLIPLPDFLLISKSKFEMKKILLIVISVFIILPSVVKAQGCMEPSSSDGVAIIGYIQPQFDYGFYKDDDQGIKNESSFLFNRARLGVTGQIPYDISYYALAEFSPTKGGPYLLDFFVTYHGLGPWANISIGQFKQPFGLELSTPCHKLHTIDRSQFVNALASPFRDMGVMVYGGTDSLEFLGLKNKDVFSWKLALVNGTGLNTMDNNMAKDFVGRLVFSPWRFIKVGGSYRYGKQKNPSNDTLTDTRMRWGADVSLEFFNFLVQGEYIFGNDKGSKIEGGGCGEPDVVIPGDFESNGYSVMALYNTPWNFQPVVKYDCYDPDAKENFNKRNAFTFGFNYFLNDWTRIQVNYVYNVEESSDTDLSHYHEIPNDMLMIQIQAQIQ